jgi:hypothetical protein
LGLLNWFVDPNFLGRTLGSGPSADEALWVSHPGLVENVLSLSDPLLDEIVVDIGWREQSDASVMVLFIVPGKEIAAERTMP